MALWRDVVFPTRTIRKDVLSLLQEKFSVQLSPLVFLVILSRFHNFFLVSRFED